MICLDYLNKYLDKDKSRPKNLDFKNLDRDKIKVDLDVMDNLDRFQKLVSTRWTFISQLVSNVETPKLKFILFVWSQITLLCVVHSFIVIVWLML